MQILTTTILDRKNVRNQEYELIKIGLRTFYGITSYELDYTENGKPYLKDINVYISISHDEELLTICFDDKEIGIDLQYVPDKVTIKKLLNMEDKTNKEVVIEFCKRESAIKLEGLLLKDFNSIDTSLYDYKIYDKGDYVIVICTKKEL